MGLLVGGALTGNLVLVYAAIGVAALASVMLAVGTVIWRREIFGEAQAPVLAPAIAGATGASGAASASGAGAGAGRLGEAQVGLVGDVPVGPVAAPPRLAVTTISTAPA